MGSHGDGLDQVMSRVGRSDIVCKKWGLVAMETLRNVLGQSAMTEVVVHGDVRPGDQLVIYCNTDGGKVTMVAMTTPPLLSLSTFLQLGHLTN